MILEQHYLGCLAQASYFIADERTKTAVVVDPRRDVELYLERARELGAEIRHVMLTHFHADFLAGHLELRERCGAAIWLGARAEAEFEFEPMKEGRELVLGDVRISFLETPGHTPESTSILVYDDAKATDAPEAVLTGDTLFIGDVGRPDLMASVGLTAPELAGMLYDSLHEKLLALPDETIVYPGHGAGSMCGKNLSSETSSTIGAQRAANYALQEMPKDDFVRMLTADQPDAPAYFPFDAALNKKERPTLDTVLGTSLRALPIDEVLSRRDAGAALIDTRDADAFARGHLAGSINIGLGGKYASWAGTLVAPEREIVIIASPGTEAEATSRLGRIGFDQVAGHLDGGFASVPEVEVRRGQRLTPDELRVRLGGKEPPLIVDVRQPGEWDSGHIEGAMHVPLGHVPRELERIPRDRDLVMICKSGYRSSTAVSLVEQHTERMVADVTGGMDAYAGEACAVDQTS